MSTTRASIITATGLACGLAAAAAAQPPDPFGGAPKARVAAPAPAPPSARAGEGGGPAGGPATLEEAFAACDIAAVLRLGGGDPRDAIRVLMGRGVMLTDPVERPTWTRTPNGFALTFVQNGARSDMEGPRGASSGFFGGWTPPDIAALPDADQLFGPPPPRPTPYMQAVNQRATAAGEALARNALSGMKAPDAAAAYYAARPELLNNRAVWDPSQAFYVRCTIPPLPSGVATVCLRTAAWGLEGQEIRVVQPLLQDGRPMDPQNFPGAAALPSMNDPLPADIKLPAEVLRRRALPPNPLGPGQARDC